MHANTAFPGSVEIAIISQIYDLCISAQIRFLWTFYTSESCARIHW
jgi:hypothetical protein